MESGDGRHDHKLADGARQSYEPTWTGQETLKRNNPRDKHGARQTSRASDDRGRLAFVAIGNDEAGGSVLPGTTSTELSERENMTQNELGAAADINNRLARALEMCASLEEDAALSWT